jgi:hypothetical protein
MTNDLYENGQSFKKYFKEIKFQKLDFLFGLVFCFKMIFA